VPTDPAIWINAAKLEEAQGNNDMVSGWLATVACHGVYPGWPYANFASCSYGGTHGQPAAANKHTAPLSHPSNIRNAPFLPAAALLLLPHQLSEPGGLLHADTNVRCVCTMLLL
jgi:hypothetical protein